MLAPPRFNSFLDRVTKLILQIVGDGSLKLAAAEVQPALSFRVTAKVVGEVPQEADLASMADVGGQGRCAIILAPAFLGGASALFRAPAASF